MIIVIIRVMDFVVGGDLLDYVVGVGWCDEIGVIVWLVEVFWENEIECWCLEK